MVVVEEEREESAAAVEGSTGSYWASETLYTNGTGARYRIEEREG